MSSKLFGEVPTVLDSAGSVSGTTMIVKALEDSTADIIFNGGASVSSVSIPAFGTVEGVQQVTYGTGTLVIYK